MRLACSLTACARTPAPVWHTRRPSRSVCPLTAHSRPLPCPAGRLTAACRTPQPSLPSPRTEAALTQPLPCQSPRSTCCSKPARAGACALPASSLPDTDPPTGARAVRLHWHSTVWHVLPACVQAAGLLQHSQHCWAAAVRDPRLLHIPPLRRLDTRSSGRSIRAWPGARDAVLAPSLPAAATVSSAERAIASAPAKAASLGELSHAPPPRLPVSIPEHGSADVPGMPRVKSAASIAGLPPIRKTYPSMELRCPQNSCACSACAPDLPQLHLSRRLVLARLQAFACVLMHKSGCRPSPHNRHPPVLSYAQQQGCQWHSRRSCAGRLDVQARPNSAPPASSLVPPARGSTEGSQESPDSTVSGSSSSQSTSYSWLRPDRPASMVSPFGAALPPVNTQGQVCPAWGLPGLRTAAECNELGSTCLHCSRVAALGCRLR